MSKKVIAGIDPGDDSIKIVVTESRDDSPVPRLLSAIRRPSGGFRRGVITNMDEAIRVLGSAVRSAEKATKQRIKRAYIGLQGAGPGGQIVDGSAIVSRADSEITESDIKTAVDAAESKIDGLINKRILDVIPIAYKLDGKKILKSPQGMKGTKLEIRLLFITCFAHQLDELYDVVEANRVSVMEALPAPIAASYVSLNRSQKMAGAVLADIGAGTTQVSIFEEGLPHSVETFDLGSQDITNDIALGLKISLEEAEEIKLQRSSHVFAQRKLEEIIEARLADIFEKIQDHLKKLGRNELLPAGIVMTGGGSMMPKIESIASRELNLPARVATPLFPRHIAISDENEKELSRVILKDPSFAVAYGLSIYGQDPTKTRGIVAQPLFMDSLFAGSLRWLKNFLP